MLRAALVLILALLWPLAVPAESSQSGERADRPGESDFRHCGNDVINRVSVGMRAQEVRAVCPRPYDRSRTRTENGMREKWVYRARDDEGTVYFHEERVTSVER